MQGIRFYLEHDTPAEKRNRISSGNVVAVLFENKVGNGMEAIGAVYEYPDSPVAGTSVAREYLRTKTRRVSEEFARAVHPALFTYLDSSELKG